MMGPEYGPFIALKNGPTKIIKSNGGGLVGLMMWPSVHVAGAFSHGLTPMSAMQEGSTVREVCVRACLRVCMCVCMCACTRVQQRTVVILSAD